MQLLVRLKYFWHAFWLAGKNNSAVVRVTLIGHHLLRIWLVQMLLLWNKVELRVELILNTFQSRRVSSVEVCLDCSQDVEPAVWSVFVFLNLRAVASFKLVDYAFVLLLKALASFINWGDFVMRHGVLMSFFYELAWLGLQFSSFWVLVLLVISVRFKGLSLSDFDKRWSVNAAVAAVLVEHL